MKLIRWFRFPILALFLLVGLATTPSNNDFEISKNLEIFANLYKELNKSYVDPIDPSRIMKTGLDAMVGSLDPFTNYFSESQIESYRYLTEGKYNGFGAHVEVLRDFVTVIEPYDKSPAAKAGIRAGDQIVAIEGKSARGKTVDEVNAILRGFPGTQITLTIRRPGQNKDFDLTLSRNEISMPNVPYYGMVSEEIGYIALTTFTQAAGANVADALEKLKLDHPNLKGLIFDLRGNGGGLLSEAVNVSNIFVNKGELVVSTRGKIKELEQSYKTSGTPLDLNIPLVVLIDSKSASASEIVSGVIQDLDRGVLMGQRSYGKGLVQNTVDLGYNARLKLTTSKYYIPSGRCIQSVKYENGEPVQIPDDQRAVFYTRNGRPVLDGGGVKPDVVLEKPDTSALIQALQRQFVLFDYVTEYCIGIDSLADVENFRFTDWKGFTDFLTKRNFQYETAAENYLKKLRQEADKNDLAIQAEIQTIQSRIETQKKAELEKNKDRIIDLIEKDVATRYGFSRGKIQIGLRNDAEVKEAVGLLNDLERYLEILAGK